MAVNATSMQQLFGLKRPMAEVETDLSRNMSGADNSLNCPRAFEPLPQTRHRALPGKALSRFY